MLTFIILSFRSLGSHGTSLGKRKPGKKKRRNKKKLILEKRLYTVTAKHAAFEDG